MKFKNLKILKLFVFKVKKILGIDNKIFIIGRNKTGTTSVEKCLRDMGYLIGDQKTAELFIDDYARGDFTNILNFCDSAEVFQDVPFSWPETYKHLYRKYPKARYILLERDSAEDWYESLVRFHRKIVNNGQSVTAKELKEFVYIRKGFLWQVAQIVYGVNEKNIYDKDVYIENYEAHNHEVKEFFGKSENFLSINLSDDMVEKKIAKFLGKKEDEVKIPHLNRSR